MNKVIMTGYVVKDPEVNEFKIQEYDLLHISEAGKALEKT